MSRTADTPDRDRPVVADQHELAPGTWFFASIDPDGITTLWSAGDNRGNHGCNCPTCAPDEQIRTDRRERHA